MRYHFTYLKGKIPIVSVPGLFSNSGNNTDKTIISDASILLPPVSDQQDQYSIIMQYIESASRLVYNASWEA
ncbi:MAG: hypothetical protein A2Z36_03235 [Chloroflexi bacterium RBG_19FT_COMBO_48_23]|nr:MAG: hypothetical protein A2Z36_03235 [Chloroflexi bacterium RBG_19FT_COMBO_48_23]